MGGEGVIEGEGLCDVENTIFVAVGKNVTESKSNLLWTLQRCNGKKICLLHVHQPAHLATLMDGKLSTSKLKQQAVKACRELELQKMHKLLNQYLLIIAQVQAGKVWVENESIEKGIVQIIVQHGIRWLVMGAAAENHYSRKMSELMSTKAIFVCQHAPAFCHIWFACQGCLIYTRERYVDISSHVGNIVASSSPTSTKETKLLLNHAASEDEDANTSSILEYLNRSKNKAVSRSKSTPLLMDDLSRDNSPSSLRRKSQDRLFRSLSVIPLEERSQGQTTPNLYDKLEQATIDAENSKRKAFEESVTRWKAEEDAMEALRKAEASESLFMTEVNERKEMEELLERQRQESEKMKNQRDQCTKELQMVRDQMPELESRKTESHCVEKELEEKIIQAVKLLISFKEKRDEMLTDREMANREIHQLRKLVGVETKIFCDPRFMAFSFLEIIEVTQNFDPTLKIGEGKCGSVYKGLLHHVKVAIKMLPCHGTRGISEFEHEATVLSRVRHPNLVTLIGTCPESTSLVYEYLENGSLEDRLACRGKNPPLPWQTRIKTAVEICSALIFLHSNKPCIVHGNLKLTNVLLDANFVSKLSDFGIYRLIPHDENNDPMVSVYVDPEFLETGELTIESDVYSFGMVLLRMLTGRPALGVVNDVKRAIENGNLDAVLDISAGDWPLEQAKQLANLALRCCEKKRLNRPALVPDIWTLIEPMRGLCTSSDMETEGRRKVPSHFLCPIFQEVMEDPYIAADGFTYEADAIKGWLNSGHKTSPMTNLKLDHCDLLPNYALYYAIQEWLQQS